MAIREIRTEGDEILNKKCKVVKNFDEKLGILLDDMYDTMKSKSGVGLAAPQVGILKRAFVIDLGVCEEVDREKSGKKNKKSKKPQPPKWQEFINPEIIETSGEVINNEGCLSVPDVWGEVKRPERVTIKAQDRHGKTFTLTGEGLLACALCHENEHLDGHLFTEKVIRYLEVGK